MVSKRKKKKWPKYRIATYRDITGVRWWHVEERKWLWGSWYHVPKTTTETSMEAVALKTLLEHGESQYHIMKPIERCKLLGLELNP